MKKSNKSQELKKFSKEELFKKTVSLKEAIAKTKMEMKTGKIKNMRAVKALRYDLARTMTFLTFKLKGEEAKI